MRRSVVLITGGGGEIGHELIYRLSDSGEMPIVTIDKRPLDESLRLRVYWEYTGSILDQSLLEHLLAEYEVDRIYHLAALLSTRCEFTPLTAHEVNVNGTIAMLEFARQQSGSHGRTVKFLYPSSIAVYGLPDLETKARAGRIGEDAFTKPTTIYGCNKLYCEHLGRYYAHHYRQLAVESQAGRVDFRCLRFPGLISAVTVPSGGTSDYAPEMLHAAAQGKAYACFVRPDTRIPFMAMPDAVDALLQLAEAPAERLTQSVYNVAAFNPSAEEIRQIVLDHFPRATITTEVDEKRQRIVDSWPADVDDGAARRDWGFSPKYDLQRAFSEYLIPTITARYRKQ